MAPHRITVRHLRDSFHPIVNRIERACQWTNGNVSNSLGERCHRADGPANRYVVDYHPF